MVTPVLFSGTANQTIALAVAKILGQPLGCIIIDRFYDNEIMIKITANLRHKNVFIIQSTSPPVNDNIIELLLIIDAVKRAKVASITAIIPYFGYARQNACNIQNISPISANVITKVLETVGVNHIVTIDLHAENIIKFSNVPWVNLYSTQVFVADIANQDYMLPTIIAPDVGSFNRSQMLVSALNPYISNVKFVLLDKLRLLKNNITMTIPTKTIFIEGHDCIIVDDIVDTATTICLAAKILKQLGARRITAYCTHPILSGNAIENINLSALTELVVTDTVLLSPAVLKCYKIRQVSIANVIAVVILKILRNAARRKRR